MIAKLFSALFGTNNARQLKRIAPLVQRINQLETSIQALSDEALAHQTNIFRERLAKGEHIDNVLPEAFAVVRETAQRTIGQRHYDVQLIGGIILHQGKIAEMKTGEGKTLTETLPLYLNALAGRGAHLVTPNDYLARRDAAWMGPIYQHLGLSVGTIQHGLTDAERKAAYRSDIVYGTNNEIGFDYLRDNMKFRLDDYVQRELHYAIVDEVDSILIDEARTPLIISGAAEESSELYTVVNRAVARLTRTVDYEVDEKAKSVFLTEQGTDAVERSLHTTNLYAVEHMKILHHVNQALKAHALFRRDVEYMVRDGEVLIVDEFTGRILPGRRYSDGLHQAIEAKEGVTIERESQTLASITLQNLFRLYSKLAGMTGTAVTEAEEFYRIYKLDVMAIPTNRTMIRQDKPDLVFLTKRAKYKSIVTDVRNRHHKGQPVLIGTVSVETSELLSGILASEGIPHDVLNAKNHAKEAEIIATAGNPGRVTIATNMAGRGTDIKLTPESVTAGGLYVLGTERHESRRIDNQLRGRSGRQGDPGESRFYISLEDDLIRIFAGDSLKKQMQWVGMTEEDVIEEPMVSRRIEYAQERVEKNNFDIRKQLLEYDDVLNQQRKVIYGYRRSILEGQEQIDGLIQDLIADTVSDLVTYHARGALTPEKTAEIGVFIANLLGDKAANLQQITLPTGAPAQTVIQTLTQFLLEQYALYVAGTDAKMLRDVQKWVMLEAIDGAWKQHMLNQDHLKEGISLRSWGQKNPLVEYKREAFALFEDMLRAVRFEMVHHIFRLNFEKFNERDIELRRQRELDAMRLSGPAEGVGDHGHNHHHNHAGAPQPVRSGPPIGRNENCPCGTGKKYKKCCGK